MANQSWYRIEARAGATPEIIMYDELGFFGITAADFHADLKALGDLRGKPLILRISSPGGDVFMGNAIFNMLKESEAVITVDIDGVAASMASLVAMVGKVINIAANGQFMLHNPSSLDAGDHRAKKRTAALLDSLREGMVTIYAGRSGLSREVVSKMMDEETWLDAKQAVAHGFADNITEESKVTALSFEASLRKYRHPPKATINEFARAYWSSAKSTTKRTPTEASAPRSAVPELVTAKLDHAAIWGKRNAIGGAIGRAVLDVGEDS